MVSFKGAHFVKASILTCVRWYVAYPLSYRQVEERMQERVGAVEHSTINRWVVTYSPQFEATSYRRLQAAVCPTADRPLRRVPAGQAVSTPRPGDQIHPGV